ncbi:glycosyltransferase family 4 protein [Melioribacter sp. OK-6-Me]|uniref:glycosyltransferase family 4 protein n=1 Tax=unclassified Melioribacter TaxID=2627329 RepID=UPI003ED93EA4
MKILLCNKNYYHCGGVETLFLSTEKLLNDKGHTAIPFSLKSTVNYNSEYLQYFPSRPENRLLRALDSFYSFNSIYALKKVIDKFKPEIAHVHNINGGLTFSILPVLKGHKIPVVTTIHGFKYLCPVWEFYNRKKGVCEKCAGGKYYHCILNSCSNEGLTRSILLAVDSYFRDLFLNFRRYFNYFIFVSNFTRNKFLSLFPDLEKKSEVLYNFTDEIENRITKTVRRDFLFIGRIEYNKGVDLLVEAFRRLNSFKLIIAGEGRLLDTLRLTSSKNVTFLGNLSRKEIKDAIKQSYFVVISSRTYENNPYAVIEAFAAGRPVIAPALGGIPEIVENGENGFLYLPNNIDSLVGSLKSAYSLDEEKYLDMCSRALHTARNKFNRTLHYEKLINIYEKVLKEY